MLIKTIIHTIGESLIAVFISISIVFSIATLWEPDEFIGSVPLALAWSWQAIIIASGLSIPFSFSRIWIKNKTRLVIQLISTTTITVFLTLTGNQIIPPPKLLALKIVEHSEPAVLINTSIEENLENDDDGVQELPDEL